MSIWLTFALGVGAIYLLTFCWLAFAFVTAPLLDDEMRVTFEPARPPARPGRRLIQPPG